MGSDRRQTTNLVVDSRALLRLSVPFFVLLLLNVSIVFYVNWECADIMAKLNSSSPEVLNSINTTTNRLTSILLWGNCIFGSLSLLLWLIYSHRILGPSVSIRRHILNLINGDYTSRVVLRKYDEFKPIADDLNRLAEVLKNPRGQSLVQVLVSLGIMGILLSAMVSTQAMQARENQALTEKLAALDLQRLIGSALSKSKTCTYQLSLAANPTFNAKAVTDTHSPEPIDLGQTLLADGVATAPAIVTVGQPASPISSSVIVESIQIANIKCPAPCKDPAASDHFTAELRVNFVNSKLVRAIGPAVSQLVIQTADAGGSKKMTACTSDAVPDAAPPGSVCGFSTTPNDPNSFVMIDGGTVFGGSIKCKGFDPNVACPPGYNRVRVGRNKCTVDGTCSLDSLQSHCLKADE